jgi:hypothetical protein
MRLLLFAAMISGNVLLAVGCGGQLAKDPGGSRQSQSYSGGHYAFKNRLNQLYMSSQGSSCGCSAGTCDCGSNGLGDSVVVNRSSVSTWETFTVWTQIDGTQCIWRGAHTGDGYAHPLTGATPNYITNQGSVVTNRQDCGSWERWNFISLNGDPYGCCNTNYGCPDYSANIIVNANPWEYSEALWENQGSASILAWDDTQHHTMCDSAFHWWIIQQ